jgi:hypothetical protein
MVLSIEPDIQGAVEALSKAELLVARHHCPRLAATSGHDGFAAFWSELTLVLEREAMCRKVAEVRKRAIADALIAEAFRS